MCFILVLRITNIYVETTQSVHPCHLNWAAMQLKIIAGYDDTLCIIVQQCYYCSHFKHINVLIYMTCRFNGHKEMNTQFIRYCDYGTNTNIAVELWQYNYEYNDVFTSRILWKQHYLPYINKCFCSFKNMNNYQSDVTIDHQNHPTCASISTRIDQPHNVVIPLIQSQHQ